MYRTVLLTDTSPFMFSRSVGIRLLLLISGSEKKTFVRNELGKDKYVKVSNTATMPKLLLTLSNRTLEGSALHKVPKLFKAQTCRLQRVFENHRYPLAKQPQKRPLHLGSYQPCKVFHPPRPIANKCPYLQQWPRFRFRWSLSMRPPCFFDVRPLPKMRRKTASNRE